MHHVVEKIEENFQNFPDNLAIKVGEQSLSYEELWNKALIVAGRLKDFEDKNIGVFCFRELETFVHILGVLMAGKCYVPLKPDFPVERLAKICQLASIKLVLVEKKSIASGIELAQDIHLNFLSIEEDTNKEMNIKLRGTFGKVVPFDYSQSLNSDLLNYDLECNAYLLFTSGSTGVPKGVAVKHSNLSSYLSNFNKIVPVDQNARCSQTFELTFDLSVHDIFITWVNGACLCVASAGDMLFPGNYINKNDLTHWFSVPSLASHMGRVRQLSPGLFPNLKFAMFCGEALSEKSASNFSEAAPNSKVFNLYGPTEATIAISSFEYNDQTKTLCQRGLVPIGKPFESEGFFVRTLEVGGYEDGPCSKGELVLVGNQVTVGYLNDPEKTDCVFKKINSDIVGYHTGDLVECDQTGVFHFIERIDLQVKIQGHRIEIAEVEGALHKVVNTDQIFVVPWPYNAENFECLYAVYNNSDKVSKNEVIAGLREYLPEYMLPRYFQGIDEFPLNASGKIDRKKIAEMLDKIIGEYPR